MMSNAINVLAFKLPILPFSVELPLWLTVKSCLVVPWRNIEKSGKDGVIKSVSQTRIVPGILDITV